MIKLRCDYNTARQILPRNDLRGIGKILLCVFRGILKIQPRTVNTARRQPFIFRLRLGDILTLTLPAA